MRDRDDLDVLADDPVDEVKGKLQKNESAATVRRFWITLRGFLDAYQCVVDLSAKFCGSCVAPLEIPESVAERSSALASGWKLTLLAEAAMQLRSHLLPRNGLDLSGVDLSDAPLDLLSPRCFNVGLRFGFEALKQKARELRSFALGKLRCLSIQILECSPHRWNRTSASGTPSHRSLQRFSSSPSRRGMPKRAGRPAPLERGWSPAAH
jgi:hypothetical protein